MVFWTTFLSSLLSVALSQSTLGSETSSGDPNPTCIVGAGLSGLNLAHLLQQKGHVVQLFDKQSMPGGKIATFRIKDEIQVEMGPLFFGSWEHSILKQINEFQLTPVPFNISDIWGIDPFNGVIGALWSHMMEDRNATAEALRRYLYHRSKYEKEFSFDSGFGYTQISPDLFVPIGQWLEERDLSILKPAFWLILTTQGYGDVEDTPALYALQFGNKEHITVSTISQKSYYILKEGLDVLAQKMAEKIQNVHLDQEVVHIERILTEQDSRPSVVLTTLDRATNLIKTTRCGKVILAFPPLHKNLEQIIPDLTTDEREVLGHVRITKYSSAAHIIPNLKSNIYCEGKATDQRQGQELEMIGPVGQGEIVALIRQSLKSVKDVYSSYSWIRGESNSSLTHLEMILIQQQMERTIKQISPDSKTLFQKSAEYFPHVRTSSLHRGFYKKLDQIQGQGGLYYATTLLGFELMDLALKMTEAFVKKYF